MADKPKADFSDVTAGSSSTAPNRTDARACRAAHLHRGEGRHVVAHRQAVLRRREQVAEDLRGQRRRHQEPRPHPPRAGAEDPGLNLRRHACALIDRSSSSPLQHSWRSRPARRKKPAARARAGRQTAGPSRARAVCAGRDRPRQTDRGGQEDHRTGERVRPCRHHLRIGQHHRRLALDRAQGALDVRGRPARQRVARGHRPDRPGGHRSSTSPSRAAGRPGNIRSRSARPRECSAPRRSRSTERTRHDHICVAAARGWARRSILAADIGPQRDRRLTVAAAPSG